MREISCPEKTNIEIEYDNELSSPRFYGKNSKRLIRI